MTFPIFIIVNMTAIGAINRVELMNLSVAVLLILPDRRMEGGGGGGRGCSK